MPFTLTMPKLSPTMESGVIAKWHKKEGDFVESGDLLVEVSTDKATVEHNALDEGYLRKILVIEGSEAEVNQPIAVFTEKKDENITNYKPQEEKVTQTIEKTETQELQPKKIGKTKEPETPSYGLKIPTFVPEPPLEKYKFEPPNAQTENRIVASPLARKLAKEKGLDLSSIKGSGPGGRIMKRDLQKARQKGSVPTGERDEPEIQPGTYEEEELNPMRKVITQRLQEAKTFIPHFYVQQTINASPLVEFREQLHNMEIEVTFNDCVVRACALALKDHPVVNSGFNSTTNKIIRFKTIDISVAVSVKEGLITPIVRHADYKTLSEISVEIRNLAKRAREGKLELHEFKGGSFTVSNLGMFGITNFQAIINPPQAAIIAISGINNVPVVKNGEVIPGKVMSLTISADHRVVDGVAASQFIKTVQNYLENPVSLIL